MSETREQLEALHRSELIRRCQVAFPAVPASAWISTAGLSKDVLVEAVLSGECPAVLATPATPAVGNAAVAGGGDLVQIIADAVVARIPKPEVDKAQIDEQIEAGLGKLASSVRTLLDEVVREAAGHLGATPARVLKAVAVRASTGSEDCPIARHILTYASPAAAVAPVLVRGEQGASKTYTARRLGQSGMFECYVEVACYAGIEGIDLIGGYVQQAGTAGLVWCDGPIAQAFRSAASGKSTFLLVDEILRIPARERGVLLTSLTPDNGVYRLRVPRIANVQDGVGAWETIEAPVANLSIVATTNVGGRFGVEDDDDAQAERWVPLTVRVDEDAVARVLADICATYSWADRVRDGLVKLFVEGRRLKAGNLLQIAPSIRTVCRACHATGGDVAKLKDTLNAEAQIWVGLTFEGEPIPEQVKSAQGLIDAAFAAITGGC